jgi:hypothetical protein
MRILQIRIPNTGILYIVLFYCTLYICYSNLGRSSCLASGGAGSSLARRACSHCTHSVPARRGHCGRGGEAAGNGQTGGALAASTGASR